MKINLLVKLLTKPRQCLQNLKTTKPSKPPQFSQTTGFLSIDIAFGLVIMSLSFVILFGIQGDISRAMQNRDVDNFLESNARLLENIRANAGQRRVIRSDSGREYEAVFFSSESKGYGSGISGSSGPKSSSSKNGHVVLHFYK